MRRFDLDDVILMALLALLTATIPAALIIRIIRFFGWG
jgi:hypothetical protein